MPEMEEDMRYAPQQIANQAALEPKHDPSNPDQAGDWYANQPDDEQFLTDAEEEAYEAINWAMKAIQDMGLSANPEEFALHIHGLQSFVDQHVLHRLNPGYYSNWYTKSPPESGT